MAEPVLLSRGQYAAHRKKLGLPGNSTACVTMALQKGRITLVQDGSLWGKINPDIADREWAANTSPGAQRAGVLGGAVRAYQIETTGEHPKLVAKERLKTGQTRSEESVPRMEDYAASRAAKEYYDAELARLKFEEKEKILVASSVVTKLLYEAGRIIRSGHDSIVCQLAPALASETDILAVEKRLKVALLELDEELADKIANLQESFIGGDDEPRSLEDL